MSQNGNLPQVGMNIENISVATPRKTLQNVLIETQQVTGGTRLRSFIAPFRNSTNLVDWMSNGDSICDLFGMVKT